MENNTPEYHEFQINSAKYLTLLTKKFGNRKVWQKSNPKEVRSFIPGSITEVNAVVGEKRKTGDTLLTLDAMKMYSKIEMPFDGIIKEVLVKKGDRIPKNALMIVIE